jgi:hypothetical protein
VVNNIALVGNSLLPIHHSRFITFASHQKAGETNILAYKAKTAYLLWYNHIKK